MTGPYGVVTRALGALDGEDAHNAAIAALKLGLGPRAVGEDPILARGPWARIRSWRPISAA